MWSFPPPLFFLLFTCRVLFVLKSFRHADLLASDISEDQCIKYIDRFLMFYIATADRLQRTSTWLDKLEGGEGERKAFSLCEIIITPWRSRAGAE